MCIRDRYKYFFDEQLVTVWSAPNYCYRCGNIASVLELDENLSRSFKIFEATPQDHRGPALKHTAPDYFLQFQPHIQFLSLIHISEPTRPLYISYAVFCLKKKKKTPDK
eukprot:TRINITY_DN5244_c0_g1_i2.p2 TRINITY_DN5244_c0_g1~~TRINITY_DN5244_c0_g1_i2.p2  ORF type:complete len:109 (+),score=22.25 TRINITY_DN5244_c0_g1_i2:177-503(+)